MSDAVSYRALFNAFRQARRGKKPSANQLTFETDWMSNLIVLQQQLESGTWSPKPTTCFIATRPKAREIHAPDFADRVVHHAVVPPLEAIYEPVFIHGSFANRAGKGTHAAVDYLRSCVRQVHSGQGRGWALKLDIHNFFYSINREILWGLVKARMQRHGLPMALQRAVHALLRHSRTATGVRYRATVAERALVPPHKRLENAPAGFGLPIGDLSSQFLANVYLNELDQFVKHTLKAKRYVRYVDDFVIVHQDRQQLEAWLVQIETFLRDRLKLRLKPDIQLRPLTDGIDFLGYVVYPTHTRVRKRVVRHADAALKAWAQRHVTPRGIRARPEDLRAITSTWASTQGHFKHASAYRLTRRFHARHPWLAPVTETRRRFHHRIEGRYLNLRIRHGTTP